MWYDDEWRGDRGWQVMDALPVKKIFLSLFLLEVY